MARVVKPEEGWIEEFKNSLQTKAELERMKVVLEKAAELRKHTNIAPLTTADLVRAVRDEQDENS